MLFQVKTESEEKNSSSNHFTSVQIKLVLIFCAYGLATLIIYTVYSVVVRHEGPFTEALEEYLACESTGKRICSREKFEELDPTAVALPLVVISYALLPVSTLIYVANVEKLLKRYKTKFKFLTRSTEGNL